MDTIEAAEKLASYTKTLHDFRIAVSVDGNYQHMGATIVDAILQAGLKYDSVVRPGVRGLLKSYPNETTTSAFARVLDAQGAEEIVKMRGAKPKRVVALTEFLKKKGIEEESHLKVWIQVSENRQSLMRLSGIKNKTADYLARLVSVETSAPDMWLFQFLEDAHVPLGERKYEAARDIVNKTADILGISNAV